MPGKHVGKAESNKMPKAFRHLTAMLADLNPDEVYAAGVKQGRRLAMRTVRAAMAESKHEHCDACWYLGEIILEKLGARPAKRKGVANAR
jgi:hypothetical protein